MAVFYLKYRDTLPILNPTLKNPDGSVHDLTAAVSIKVHIKLSTGALLTWSDQRLAQLAFELGSGAVLTRTATVDGAPTNGKILYPWVATDWDAGGLVLGSHRMEYEIIAATSRYTFPNGGYDVLKIGVDIGQS